MRLILLSFALLIAACGSLDAVTKSSPKALTFPSAETRIIFDRQTSVAHSVDLGSLLFRKTIVYPREPILGVSTVGDINPLPGVHGWESAWTYTGSDAPGADIYTHPEFYGGEIGVILDRNGDVATKEPLIQVVGVKKGRRWPLSGGPEFVRGAAMHDSWALRYGGQREDGHRFLIVSFADEKEKDIAQDFRVSFDEARTGFSVKGVWVKIHSYEGGRLAYSFTNSSSVNQ